MKMRLDDDRYGVRNIGLQVSLLALLGLCWLGGSAAGTATSTIILENAFLRLDIAPLQHGQLTDFLDKQSGCHLLASTGAMPVYAIDCQQGTTVKTLTATTAQFVTSHLTMTSTARTVSLIFHHPSPDLTVTCAFSLGTNATEIACELSVTSAQEFVLRAIRFPGCVLPLPLGASVGDDRLLLPFMDGIVLQSPATNMSTTMQAVCDYPGTASMQMIADYATAAGIYFITYDRGGYRKQLGFYRSPQLCPQLEHYPVVTPCRSYALPYPIGMGVLHGDWQAAADIYRRWATAQAWCRTPLAQRLDIPSWLLRAPLCYTIAMRGFPLPAKETSYCQWLPQHIREYQSVFNTPVTPILLGWEHFGYWITPDYFPPFEGDTAFREMTARLEQDDNRAMVFLSALKWTLRKTSPANYDGTAEFVQQGAGMAVMTATGVTCIAGSPTDDMGNYAWLCPGDSATVTLMSNNVYRCQNLGLTAVQLDQLVGGGVPPCYSTVHGHPVGGGNWSYSAVNTMLARLRREGKTRNPDFVLTIEEPGELFIPVLDAYLAREYAENRWPREAKGVHGVPFFSYVYHQYLPGLGGDSVTISAGAQPQNVYALAVNLVDGKIPAAAVWGQYLPAQAVDAQQAAMLHAALDCIHGYAHDYLLTGQRLATPPLAVQEVPVACTNPATNTTVVNYFPAVLHSKWLLRDGRIGYVLANHTTHAIVVPLPVSGAASTGQTRYTLRTWQSDHGAPSTLSPSICLPTTVTVTVPASHAVWVEAIPAVK